MRRLRSLVGGLPPEARLAREDPTEPEWGVTEELLAQMVEVMSVYASERRLKEPRVIPRPTDRQKEQQQREERAVTHGGLLGAAAGRVRQSA